ncbi:glutathione S-transferase family protein [Schlegelella sp. S2-27]|uniref:Glutathione S-transferase family protein n=1 Tax=Caldimonas mangrovi TaxID=2944811 RepID=A0ABT0YU23_9BURK|nr:glutathione S-transferase family protein [Caldimonas mangrovi]MCM5682242.1 glutathione S-transferase family protein [Caldimonas mangrovi]
MLKLYFNPQSRAAIAKWMLDEAGAEYELVHVDLQKREHKTPEYLRINPAGKLPALVDGDTHVFEGAAVCLYVAEQYPQARLAPAVGAPERGRFLSLMVYSTSQLEPSMGDTLLKLPHHPARGWTDFEAAQDVVERELGDGPYLFGDWFTAADVMIGSMFIWKRMFGGPPDRPSIAAYVDRLLQRPKCGMKPR